MIMESLVNFQFDISKRIKNALSNFKKSPKDRITKTYLETRLDSVDQLWLEFLMGHKDLLRNNDPVALKASIYVSSEIYDTTEDTYTEYKCLIKEALEMFCVDDKGDKISSNDGKMSKEGFSSAQVKLPKINIPTFSGKYKEWTTFRDLYCSMVHTNKNLDNVQKLHYLKGYLTGEAEQLLRHIPILHGNYTRCWGLIEERYNNKKYICHHVLQSLLNQRNLVHESAVGLKNLMDTTDDCLHALTNIGVDVNTWDVVIIHLLTMKLDPESRRQWEFHVNSSSSLDELPTYKQFKEYLVNRYHAIEFLEPGTNICKRTQVHQHVNKFKSLHVSQIKCVFCSGEHKLYQCPAFSQKAVKDRRKFIENNQLCFICLGQNHSARFCRFSGKCRICNRKHHSLLHPSSDVIPADEHRNKRELSKDTGASFESSDLQSKGTKQVVSCFSREKIYCHNLLATALVTAHSKRGSFTVRALLDQGSQASFVTEAVVQHLGLKKIPVTSQISGLAHQEGICKAMVKIEIESRVDSTFKLTVEAYVLRSITGFLPSKELKTVEWLDINELTLADPGFNTPGKIDLLLGAGEYGKIIQPGVHKGPEGTPIAQASSLGWILSGEIQVTHKLNDMVKSLHCRTDENELLKKFWEIEAEVELPKEKMLKEEERLCEERFSETTERDCEGRYIVCLPFKTETPEVSNSLEIAKKRLLMLEKRLDKNTDLKDKYHEVIKEYLSLNHMEEVPETEIENPKAIYLPHHAVIRNDKATTKVRVVYDASCKGSNQRSLNDNLLIGPTLQPELRHLIMRWRSQPICLTADIAKMYRQVKVHKNDVDYQRILWRDEPATGEIKHYRLLTVTFGTASAPYLAVKVLQQLALDEGANFPLACEKLTTDYYVDDLLTGCQSIEEGKAIYRQMNDLLAKGGFELLKWSSNSNVLLEEIDKENNKDATKEVEEDRNGKDTDLRIKTDDIIKIVGLIWDRSEDSFHYVVDVPCLQPPVTKRKIISDISRLYDPLGWVSPCIIIAKIIIQKLWLAGIEWDSEVPTNLLNEWLNYRQELKGLAEIHLPRWINTRADDIKAELHGFSDASKAAYAAVVYIRVTDAQGNQHVRLLSAKTKVAPVKQVSIPRLELCGAVLLMKLMSEIAEVMKIDKSNWHAWTDSTVVLAWLNSHPSRWKVFVANRVSEIITHMDAHHWSYVPTKQNPADCASRGLRPTELVNNSLWFYGPKFLSNEPINYSKPTTLKTELEIVRTHCATIKESLWEKFSSLARLVRVTAYCRRFLKKSACRQMGYLTTQELKEALMVAIKQHQDEAYKEEIDIIRKNQNIPKSSVLRSLNPYIDEYEVLRVGGRLEHSLLSDDRKHPILLPKKCHLTNLIIANAHHQLLHGGPQLTLNYLQSKYFIPGAKQLVKAHCRKCVTCVRHTAAVNTPLMGQLPASRVTPMRAFKCSGVDYAGPIQIRTSKGRGHSSYKGYICLFVCMSTRAIHLEAVTDCTSQGFLQAFKRFVARRGVCSDLWSDNATNFVGADRELRVLFRKEKNSMIAEVAEELATHSCTWHFIPARSPNFGGLWEAGVKSVKYHLKRVIGVSTLTFEEMSTVLTQIEACLNSRPLSVIENDTDGMTIITPGHFLIGESVVTSPDRNYELKNVSSLKRWQYAQRMLQDFWRRWSQEYLTKFYHRYRWASNNLQLKVDDVVVVKEDNLPPCRWLLGRVVETHPGSDQIIRVVTLKLKSGYLKRPVSKLCLLPIDN